MNGGCNDLQEQYYFHNYIKMWWENSLYIRKSINP